VVSTCCYVARVRGVRSAMPMFKALALCPEAVVIKPRMAAYAAASRAIRALFEELTPAVEPLSLDEAFLDLAGVQRLHRASPAEMLARLQARIAREVGVTVTVGLSHNKFLAKLASELDKPRGFSVVGRAETLEFLAPRPVSSIWGVGRALADTLAASGVERIADLRRYDKAELTALCGAMGARLHDLARGIDSRAVSPEREARSVSAEATFDVDIGDEAELRGRLWRLCVKVTDRMKAQGLVGRTVALKLKRADFRVLTRRRGAPPTQLADALFAVAAPLLSAEVARGPFRLIGVGLSDLSPAASAALEADLIDRTAGSRERAERAVDAIRARFGSEAITKGRGAF
jgi:DNA polymerase-4